MASSERCLTELEKVWLAAITDGEGCIRVNRTRRPKTRSGWRFYPNIELTNTDKRLVDKYVDLCGPWVTRISNYGNNHFCENAKERWQVSIRYRNCEPFLRAIRPYLVCKGEQADVVLEFLQLQAKNGKTARDTVLEYNEYYIKTRLLNLRGTKPLDVEALRADIMPEAICT